MTSYFFVPPLVKMTGGMAVISQIASSLHESGFSIEFAAKGNLPQDFPNTHSLPITQIGEIRLSMEDRWIVPEGWPAVLAMGLNANAKCVAYVQNWAFLHGLLPSGVKWADLPVRLFAVSSPVSLFIERTTGINAPVVAPSLNRDIFYPSNCQKRDTAIKIAWMPRKNKHLAIQIKTIFESIVAREEKQLPKWISIENMSPENVGKMMRTCDIFLSTGFPEGFGLPPLEAMACGCLVAGFTGMGGWDYMRQALPGGFKPPFTLPDVSWGPNGYFAADGDVWGAVLALEAAYKACLSGKQEPIIQSGLEAAEWYNKARQKQQITELWKNNEFWRLRLAR